MLEPRRFAPGALRLATIPSILAAMCVLGLGACAGLAPSRPAASVTVAPSDRLYLEIAPFDSAAMADLSGAGLNAARVADDLDAEIRYQLALRGQEEARSAGDATVSVKVAVRRLQPGSGRSGSFASFVLISTRGKSLDTAAWEWRARSRDNVPEAYAARHLARTAAAEVLGHMKARTSKREPPPPLVLLQ
ncbi:MAG TPA: hypothetical protein VHO02_05810 [Fibrobacteria bacterium]|nr:hypothetical protein [Fibrobacteria bacterium]